MFGGANFTYPDWRGTVDIESDLPLATVNQVIWSNGGDGDGTGAGAYAGLFEASPELFFPSVVYTPSLEFTRLVIMNLGEEDTALRFQYYADDGNLDHEIDTDVLTGYPITATGWASVPAPNVNRLRPFEARIYDTHIPGTVTPDLAAGGGWNGSVRVASLDGQGLAGVATQHGRAYGALAYNALVAGADRSFLPSLERRPSDGTLGYSVLRIQCIESDGDGDCDVDINFIQSSTGQVTQRTCSINQNGTKAVNTKLLSNDGCTGGSLPAGNWVGAADVQTTDGSLIGVMTMTIREASARASAYVGAGEGDAGANVYAPDVYKKGVCEGSWNQWSIISVQNISEIVTATVSLHFLGRYGMSLPDIDITNKSISPQGVFRYSTRGSCGDLSTLGNEWEGSVRVQSNVPVAVVAETFWQDKMSAYNGVPYP